MWTTSPPYPPKQQLPLASGTVTRRGTETLGVLEANHLLGHLVEGGEETIVLFPSTCEDINAVVTLAATTRCGGYHNIRFNDTIAGGI